MKPRKTWILVADGARARVLENDGPGTGLTAALNFDFAASHAPTRDLTADKPGRGQGSAGSGAGAGAGGTAGHAKPSKVDWHTFEKHLFAKTLAAALEGALQKSAYDDLVIVAPPAALGELRLALADGVKSRVSAELGKDLTHLSVHEMSAHLEDTIRL